MAIKKFKWPTVKKFRDFHKQERYQKYISEIKYLGEQLKSGSINQQQYEISFDNIQYRYQEFR